MLKSKMRLLGVSALVGTGLIAASPADAYNVRIGDFDIQIDNVLSVGATVRVEDREDQLLGAVNGGNPDLSPGLDLGANTSGLLGDQLAGLRPLAVLLP